MRLFYVLLLFFAFNATAQQVPSRMEVAGIKLDLSKKLQEDLQKEVDALTASPKYFQILVDRANIYFPVIERIFQEKGVPDDIKYLVLQESALMADVVSTSDAVGYWQFKDFTAMEVGMRVDKQIDERMNIVSATRGAAEYLHKNNSFFDNWIYAIQAYQMGAGGAMKVVDEKLYGAKSMDLDHKLYWYVKKFIAHKIAFESAVGGTGGIVLHEYKTKVSKSLKEVADEMSVSYDDLSAYNLWVRKDKIPDDKVYSVLVPLSSSAVSSIRVTEVEKIEPAAKPSIEPVPVSLEESTRFPVKDLHKPLFSSEKVVRYNSIPGMKAENNATLISMAESGEVSLSKFLNYNDLDIAHRPKEGQVYYFKRKKAKASTHYHIVRYGEDLWSISQKYGVRLNKLMLKNRLEKQTDIEPGLVLWLRFVRPEHVPAEIRDLPDPKPKIEEKRPVVVDKAKESAPPKIVETSVGRADSPETNSLTGNKAETVKVIDIKPVKGELQDTVLSVGIEDIVKFSPDTVSKEVEAILEERLHTVAPKETFYSISKLYEVKVINILEWNDISINDKLSIGQELKILVPKTMPDRKESVDLQESSSLQEIYHEVQMGETLYQIARQYEVTVEVLMEWNGKTDYGLKPGEKLVIKKAK